MAPALLELAVAAGQRLLLQAAAPSPAGEEAASAASPAAAPAEALSASNTSSDGGYQVSFGSSACQNLTGSLPICYNTVISGENLLTGMWVNLILGIVIYLGFVAFRGMKGFEFYHARLLLPAVSRKPPQLKLHGHQRFWGWLLPVFKVTDEQLVRSAGLDALIGIRIISFGVMLFLPMTLLSLAVLLPINYTSDFYLYMGTSDNGEQLDAYTSTFMRMTISNIRQHSPRLWAHFAFVYLNVFWTSWLIVEYYKEYIALRQTYLVRCTTMPGSGRGTSMGSATPLLTPSMHASRSPMKRALAVAQSPSKRGLAGGSGGAPGGGGLRPSGSSGSLTSLRGTVNRLKLPRRHASGAGEDFGEFAFRPSRFASPNGSPQHGSPSVAAAEVAGSGSIFSFGGPSRFSHHARSNSKGSPLPPVAVSADGTSAAARGLAAALAALPPGSPLTDRTPTSQSVWLQGAASGVELADNPAFGMTAEGTPEASGQSTPASDMGGPVRRPLLARMLHSSDRQPDASPERQQRRQAVRHVGDDSRPPSADAETPVSAHQPQQQDEEQASAQQQQQLVPVDRSTLSISFGKGPGFAAMRSISLNGSSSSEDGESDTAASPEPRALGTASIVDVAAYGPAAAVQETASSVEPLGGSSLSLLSLEQQQQQQGRPSSGGTEGGERSGGSTVSLLPPPAPLPPGRRPRGLDAVAALDALPAAPRHHASSSYDVATALGFDQAPPDPQEIFAALAGKGAAGSSSANGDAQLPAVYPPGLAPGLGGAAEPAPAAEPGGGEGIATRWWAAQHGVLSDTRLLHSSQSITMKGAVRVAGGGPGKDLAANASLYTCLVMDMPLERLKLRRIGVFPVLWRHMQQEPTQSLSRASTLALAYPSVPGGPGMSGEPREDIEAALEDLERGPSPPDSARYDVDAHALGLKSMMSSACNWWHQRGRLAEWRRDVRWAMFNKRVRIATEMFSELFGPDFDSIIPIYPTASVDKLAHKWDSKLAVLERLQFALRETPRHKVRRVAKLRERITTLQKEVTQLQAEIAAERDSVLSDLPSTCFFATFRSQQAAAIASQTNLNPIMQRLFKVLPAPRPDDVNWPALQRSWWQRTMRPLYALPIILFFMLLPIGMFTGAFAQLNIALCGSPNDPGSRSDNWYCSDDRWATFLRNTITSLAPSLILSIYHMVFLPVMVYYAAQMEGQHVSLSALDRRCADLFFYWDVFNIFLGALFGGTVLAELRTFLEDPSHIWSALGSAIPAASNFFINYVCYRALVMSAFRLFYPHQAIFTSILKWLHIIPRAKTPRDKLLEVPPRNCRYGRDIGIPVLMNFVMVCSMSVTSPLILPFGLLYFVGLWAVWRYQALYVYQRQYESGGQFWPLVAHKVVGCQFIMVVFTACVLLFKGGYTQAALLFITLPIYLLKFDTYLRRRYDDLVRQVPLMAVHNAGRSSVPADIYTPPPLRAGGHGWHPEWGKVWCWWGIPRDTI